MTVQPITPVPYTETTSLTYDLPNGAPDHHGPDGILTPTRITIRYTQHETLAIPHVIEVTIKGVYRNPDGTPSSQGNTREVWRYVDPQERPAWVVELVHDNTPAWWTA